MASNPKTETRIDQVELRKSTFCGISTFPSTSDKIDEWNYNTWQELLDVTRPRTSEQLGSRDSSGG